MFIADEFCIIDSEVSQNNFQLELVYYIITLSFVSLQNVKQTSSFPKYDRGWIELYIALLS